MGKVVKTKQKFLQHIHKDHKDIPAIKQLEFICRECPFITENRFDLKHHVVLKHSGMDIECEICGQFFVSRQELHDHRKIHISQDREIDGLNETLKNLLGKGKEANDRKTTIAEENI